MWFLGGNNPSHRGSKVTGIKEILLDFVFLACCLLIATSLQDWDRQIRSSMYENKGDKEMGDSRECAFPSPLCGPSSWRMCSFELNFYSISSGFLSYLSGMITLLTVHYKKRRTKLKISHYQTNATFFRM